MRLKFRSACFDESLNIVGICQTRPSGIGQIPYDFMKKRESACEDSLTGNTYG